MKLSVNFDELSAREDPAASGLWQCKGLMRTDAGTLQLARLNQHYLQQLWFTAPGMVQPHCLQGSPGPANLQHRGSRKELQGGHITMTEQPAPVGQAGILYPLVGFGSHV